MKVQRDVGGLLELTPEAAQALRDSPLYNEDLKPVAVAGRTWRVWHIASLWIGMAVCVPTYTLASGLIAAGMNWWQAILTVFLGNAIVLLPMALIAFAGTKYGIPYPIFCRASFGSRGAHLPALLRAGVACGWFGIQCWIGGQFLNVALAQCSDTWRSLDQRWVYAFDPKQDQTSARAAATAARQAWNEAARRVEAQRSRLEQSRLASDGQTSALEAELTRLAAESKTLQGKAAESRRYLISLSLALSFLIFWLLNVWIGYRGTESIRWMETWGAPILLGAGAVLIGWAVWAAGGLGSLLAATGKLAHTGQASFLAIFLPSLNGMIAFWSTLALNIPDFTRYARSQRDQVWGQVLGLPTTMGFYALVGVCGTLGAIVVFGEAIWDPSELLARFNSPLLSIIGGFGIFLATITTNIAANVVAPANAFSNLWPRGISYKMGVIATGAIGLLIQPWKLLADPSGYIFGWLGTYGSFLGPLAGLYLADYYLIRRQRLHLRDLYVAQAGKYHYRGGLNFSALLAFALALIPFGAATLYDLGWPGKLIVDNSWVVGLLLALVCYTVLMRNDRRSTLSVSEFDEMTARA